MNRLIYQTRFQIETLHLNDADEETKIRQFSSCCRGERTKDGGLTGASNREAVPTQGPGGGGGNGVI